MRVDEAMTMVNSGIVDGMTDTKNKKAQQSFFDFMDNAVKNTVNVSDNADSYLANATNNGSNVSTSKDYDDKTDKSQSKESDDDTSKVQKKETKTSKNNIDKASKDEEELVLEIENAIKALVAQQLGITVEELDNQLTSLGMDAMDLFDNSKLLELVMEVNGIDDVSAVLTDENLMNQVKDLTEDIQFAVEDALKENGISQEQFAEVIDDLKQTALQDDGPKVIIENDDAAVTEEVHNVQTTETAENKSDSETQADSGNENNRQDGLLTAQPQTQTVSAENIINNIQNSQPVNYSNVQMEEIVNQIVEQIKVQVSADSTAMEMQLNPESFGKVQLHIAMKDGMVTAQMSVENEAVKNAVEAQLVQLKESMNEQGVKVEAIEVTVETHEFERNLQQDSNANQQAYEEEQKKSAAKRMNLNLSLEDWQEEDLSDMSEAEALERDMMLHSGNRMSVQI